MAEGKQLSKLFKSMKRSGPKATEAAADDVPTIDVGELPRSGVDVAGQADEFGTGAPPAATGKKPMAPMKKLAVAGAGATALWGLGKGASATWGDEELAAKPLEEQPIPTGDGAGGSIAAPEPKEGPVQAPSIPIQPPSTVLQSFEPGVVPAYKETITQLTESGPDGSELAEAMKDYTSSINMAHAAYTAEKDILAKREMWQNIVNAVGKLAAGMYGLKTGLDMSGTQFNYSDWNEQRKMAQSDLKLGVDQAAQQFDLRRVMSEMGERRNNNMWERAYKQSESNYGRKKDHADREDKYKEYAMKRVDMLQEADQFDRTIAQEAYKTNAMLNMEAKKLEFQMAESKTDNAKKDIAHKLELLRYSQKQAEKVTDQLSAAAKARDEGNKQLAEELIWSAARTNGQIEASTGLKLDADFTEKDEDWIGDGYETVARSPVDVAKDAALGKPKIRVQDSQGNYYEIDPADLAEAEADGLKRVK